jgi:hypothetical protein
MIELQVEKGRVRLDKWEDKNRGEARFQTERSPACRGAKQNYIFIYILIMIRS